MARGVDNGEMWCVELAVSGGIADNPPEMFCSLDRHAAGCAITLAGSCSGDNFLPPPRLKDANYDDFKIGDRKDSL